MDAFTLNELLIAFGVVLLAGLVHGTFGIGFPMVATPVLAAFSDVKTAILLTLAPNIAVNIWSLLHGGQWLDSVRAHWPVAVWMLGGSVIGTWLLSQMDPNPFRLLLALTLALYLLSHHLRQINWQWVRNHPRRSGIGFGLLGGFLGGTVNVGGPPLLIYFMELRLAPVVWVQALNLCFLVGKTAQVSTFAILGLLSAPLLLWSVPIGIVALIGLRSGMWLRARIPAQRYIHWLRALLWGLCALLLIQFTREFFQGA